MVRFFTKAEESRIISAIQEAERQTSGEIRVHLERRKTGSTAVDDAVKTFAALGMHQTELRNGVLVFLIPHEREFAIIGDQGIDAVVPEHFWEGVRDCMQAQFRQGAFVEGVCRGIELIGEKLKTFFPYQQDDNNELPDELSYGEDPVA